MVVGDLGSVRAEGGHLLVERCFDLWRHRKTERQREREHRREEKEPKREK
jgi:hypothetical protein